MMPISEPLQALSRRLQNGETLILDGALGSEIIRQGHTLPLPLWSAAANLDCPEVVTDIHREYIRAGADIITTNTFRTTTRSYLKGGLPQATAHRLAKRSLENAVQAARQAADGICPVAGSIAPLEDCYQHELFPGQSAAIREFTELGTDLKMAGVDLLLIETMGRIDETQAALRATEPLNIECWVSFILKDGQHLGGGESLVDALAMLADFKIGLVLLNCTEIGITAEGLQTLRAVWPGRWGVYPNLGTGKPAVDGNLTNVIPDDTFRIEIGRYIDLGASVIGACCGSRPAHIRIIKNLLNRAMGK